MVAGDVDAQAARRVDPLRDNLLFVRYVEGVLVGQLLIMVLSLVDFGAATFLELSYLPLIGALSLSVLLMLFILVGVFFYLRRVGEEAL